MPANPQDPQPPPGFFQFEGQSPDGSGRCWFVIAKGALLKHFQDTGNTQKLLEGCLVPEVLDRPTGAWQDLKRHGQEEAFCYAGKPTGRYIRDSTIQVPCPPGRVFVVYVLGKPMKEGQFKVLKWNWVEEDSGRSGFPVDHETRFGRRLWPPD
jgi:hypothetical protein